MLQAGNCQGEMVDYTSQEKDQINLGLRLLLRRLAYLSSITKEERIHWHRLMMRTRILDRHLKELFVEGVETPDGTKFGGKGFRSTWQEPIAAGTALQLGKDVAAPMIRDPDLHYPWVKRPCQLCPPRWASQDPKWMGAIPTSGAGIST